MADDKECFFISPIGEEGSDERDRSDKVIEYILEEALAEYDYTVTRADHMDEPGSITNQVIQKTTDSDLVIADLTGHNPNVFYELAVRHATGEPYIQIIDSEESIPFDINDFRTVQYGLDVEAADNAISRIAEQVSKLEEDGQEFSNPISQSANLESLLSSDNPEEQQLGKIAESVSRIDRRLNRIENQQSSENSNVESNQGTHSKGLLRIDGNKYLLESPVHPAKVDEIARKNEKSREEIKQKISRMGLVMRPGPE
jgi:hypothetical protein